MTNRRRLRVGGTTGGIQHDAGDAVQRLNNPNRYSAVSTEVVTAPEQDPPPARAAT